MKRTEKGFTLIELLIVIGIIAILSSISIFAMQGARESGRDAKRKADLEDIMSAMLLYKADCGRYPSSVTFGSALNGLAVDNCSTSPVNTYMQEVPNDPLSTQSYCYFRSSYTQSCVCATLENVPATPTNCGGSCGAGSCNYAVKSP